MFSFATDQRASVKSVIEAEDLASLFTLPLSEQAYAELQVLQTELQLTPIAQGQKDTWVFIWGNQIYSSSRFYGLVFKNLNVQITFSWLWKSKCTPRIKFFGWLLLVDRLNTRNLLRRRNFHINGGYSCVMCDEMIEEDIIHLFFDCTFAQACWQQLGFLWPVSNDIHTKMDSGRRHTAHGFFMELFLVATWELWNLRNDKIFNNANVTISMWVVRFKKQVKLQLLRVKESFHPQIVQWLETII